jgi:hypothetical protein
LWIFHKSSLTQSQAVVKKKNGAQGDPRALSFHRYCFSFRSSRKEMRTGLQDFDEDGVFFARRLYVCTPRAKKRREKKNKNGYGRSPSD